jgi:aryl-alcohol dehydrogenase-like predicted oxidoreductase
MHEKGWTVLAAVDRVAAAHNATPAQVALAWIIAQPGVTAPIASGTSAEQVRELLGAVELRLSEDDMAALNAASV